MRKLVWFLALLAIAGLPGLASAALLNPSTNNGATATNEPCPANALTNYDGTNNSVGCGGAAPWGFWHTNTGSGGNVTISFNGTYTYNLTNVEYLGIDGFAGIYYGGLAWYCSNDNSTFSLVQRITGNTANTRLLNSSTGETTCRYVKVEALTPTGDGVNGYMNWLGIYGSIIATNEVVIYSPASASTLLNTTSTSLIYSINSSVNASNMTVWASLNGVASTLGYFANGSTQTTTISGLKNNANNITLTFFDGTSNYSATSLFTLLNGLNITAYNASQAKSTYLTVSSVNVSNSTNSSATYGGTTPFLINATLIPNSGGTSNLSVNITVNATGYATTYYTGNATSGNGSLFSYEIPLWRHQEFKATAANGTAITSFTFFIYNSSGFNNSYSTTNGSVYVSLGSIPSGNFIGQYVASGFNATNATFNANASSEINYTLTGVVQSGLIIYAFDEASCASSCQRIYFSYSATNGTNTTTNYSSLYFVNESYNAFPQGADTFTFNNTVNGTYFPRSYTLTISSSTAQIFNVYLLNNSVTTIAASYCVQTFSGQPISGASVTIQRLFGTSYVTVAQGTGATTGCYTFYLDSTVAYQVIASATGYTSFTGISQPVSSQIIHLTSGTLTTGFQTAYSDTDDIVQTILQPPSTSLSGDWALVNFTVYSYNSTLTNWGLYCNYNGSAIYNVNVTTSPSGGSTTTNVTLTNKTNPMNFYCYGLFDRTGYNTSFVNRTFYINFVNQTYANVSLYQIVNTTSSQAWSPQAKAAVAILSTIGIVIWGSAAIGGAAAALIALFSFSIFAFLNFIPMNWFILFVLVDLSWAWFVSRQY